MDFVEMFTRLSDLVRDAALVAGDDTQLSPRVVTVIRLNHVVEQILFRLTGQLDARGIAKKNGYGSTVRLLQQAGMALALSPPDKEVPDAGNHELNELVFGSGDDGRPHGTLDLDGLLGERLAVALGPLSKQVPEPDGSADTRTFAQRRADGLERLLDSYLAQDDPPRQGRRAAACVGDHEPWLWLRGGLYRRPPHRLVEKWWRHEADQHGPTLPATSPLHPPQRVDGLH